MPSRALPSSLSIAPFVLALAAQQPPTAAAHHFDLRPLEVLLRPGRDWFDPRLPLQSPYLNDLELDGPFDPALEDDTSDVTWAWDRVLPGLMEQLHGAPVDCRRVGAHLIVTDERAESAARRALDGLERCLGRAWCIELAELPLGALATEGWRASSILTSAEVDALLAEHPPVDSSQRSVTTRRVARFQRERLTPFVTEHCVLESMAGEMGIDPQVFVARWGRDAMAWVAPDVDGHVLLSCVWRAGEPLGPLRRAQIHGPGSSPLELAQGSGSRRMGSARLEDGGALVLADSADERLGAGIGHGPLLARVRALPGPDEDSNDIELVGLAAAHRTKLAIPGGHLNRPGTPDEARVDTDALEPLPFDLDELLVEIRAGWQRAELIGFIERIGSEMIIAGPPDARALARATVQRRLAPLERTFTVDLRSGTPARKAVPSLVVGQRLDAASPVLAALDERRMGCVVLGDTLELTSVRTWMYLEGMDFELDEEHANGDQIIGVVDSGTQVRARVLARDDGRLSLDLQWERLDTPPPPFRTTELKSLGSEARRGVVASHAAVEHPESTRSQHAGVLPVAPDEWTVVALDDVTGRGGFVHVVAVRVSEAPR